VCNTKCSTEKQIKYYQNKYIYKRTNILHNLTSLGHLHGNILSGFSFRNWNTSYALISCLSSFIFYFFFLRRVPYFTFCRLGFTKRDQNTNWLCPLYLIIECCGWQVCVTYNHSGHTLKCGFPPQQNSISRFKLRVCISWWKYVGTFAFNFFLAEITFFLFWSQDSSERFTWYIKVELTNSNLVLF